MCGIFGFHLSAQAKSRYSEDSIKKILRQGLESINHRGPDMTGEWFSPNHELAIGHKRLSILDINTRSKQPMLSQSLKTVLTYNGEIYNFSDIKKLYDDYKWKTTSDTEALLVHFENKKENSLDDFDGMFAFAAYDQNERNIFLAVDPAGKKPLYTYDDGSIFAFSSEIKAFWASGICKKEVLEETYAEYLFYGYIPAPRSAFKYVSKVLPGHYKIFHTESRSLVNKKYWDIDLSNKCNNLKITDIQDKTKELIKDAVNKRLISDVPIGAFLSGGLDSSIICFEANKQLKTNNLRTFSVGFDSLDYKEYDESLYARKVANKINSIHKELRIDAKKSINGLEIINSFDEPFADSSAIPTYLLCREAKKHISVVLSGDGGDELFGGYFRFRGSIIANNFSTPLQFLLQAIPKITTKEERSFLGYLNRFREAIYQEPEHRLATWTSYFKESDLTKHFKTSQERLYASIDETWKSTEGHDFGNRILHLNYKTYLFNDLLVKVDRASMLNSLELRSPFLDKALVEFIFSLPSNLKFSCFNTKILLKNCYRQELGREIVDRKKKGFGFPIEDFVNIKNTTVRSASQAYALLSSDIYNKTI